MSGAKVQAPSHGVCEGLFRIFGLACNNCVVSLLRPTKKKLKSKFKKGSKDAARRWLGSGKAARMLESDKVAVRMMHQEGVGNDASKGQGCKYSLRRQCLSKDARLRQGVGSGYNKEARTEHQESGKDAR